MVPPSVFLMWEKVTDILRPDRVPLPCLYDSTNATPFLYATDMLKILFFLFVLELIVRILKSFVLLHYKTLGRHLADELLYEPDRRCARPTCTCAVSKYY